MTMNRWKKSIGVLAILSVFALAATAFAYGPGQGKGYGQRGGNCPAVGMNLTEEQQGKFDALSETFAGKTQPIREDIRAKHMELNALAGNSNAKPEMITKLVNDIKDLRKKLFAEHAAFTSNVEKELGIKMPRRGGMGMNGRYAGNCGQRANRPQCGGCPYNG